MDRHLGAAMVRFAALLRHEGLPVTVTQVTDGARALEHLDLSDRDEVYLGLKSIFVGRIEEEPIFERCFSAFWRLTGEGQQLPGLMAPPTDAHGESELSASSWPWRGGARRRKRRRESR